jgi:hypothetical protein
VPSNNKINTLADYVAIHDNVYETMIYRPFLNNPYYKVMPKDQFEGKGFQEFIQANLPDHDKVFKDGIKTQWA